MLNNTLRAGAVGAGAASRYGSGSDQMMRLLAAPAPQHWSSKPSANNKWFLGIIHQCFGSGCTFSWFLNPDPHSEWNIFAKKKNFS
jgi:hypothetical protein